MPNRRTVRMARSQCPRRWGLELEDRDVQSSGANGTVVLNFIIVSNSFLLLLVRPLLLVAMHLFLVAYCFYAQNGFCKNLLH